MISCRCWSVGLTKATLNVKGPKGATKIELIVHTGLVYTWIPSEILEKLNVPKDPPRYF
jgi:hypothetical protein